MTAWVQWYLGETDARWQVPPNYRLLNSYEAHPQCNLPLPWSADKQPCQSRRRTSVPRCSRNNCFAVTLADGVMLHQCTILSAQRLSGPVDRDKVTESGSDLARGVNGVFGCTFLHTSRLWQKELCDSSRTEWSVTDICCQAGTQWPEFWDWLLAPQLPSEDLNVTL